MRLVAPLPGPVADAPFTAPYPYAVCDHEPGRFAPAPRRAEALTPGLAAWFAERLTGTRA